MVITPAFCSLVWMFLLPFGSYSYSDGLKLIAHRGGVVDAERIENNVAAIEEAITRNYDMVENDLLDSALVIGTQQSKQHFAGKAKVGIGIEALRVAIAEEADVAKKYCLFAHGKDLDESIVALADKHGVTVVPSVNVFHYPAGELLERAAADLRRLKQFGVTYFQIDSVYETFLRE